MVDVSPRLMRVSAVGRGMRTNKLISAHTSQKTCLFIFVFGRQGRCTWLAIMRAPRLQHGARMSGVRWD